MRKIRKFGAGGSTEDDAQEARDKASGLAASNAELERGDRKPSGFLGLGRFLQGNIDQKGSEAYNLYGAGYGREIEAKNARLKAATLKDAANNEKRISDAARSAEDAKSEARIKAADNKIAETKARANKFDIADMKQSASSARAVAAPEAAPEAAPAALTRGITVPKADSTGLTKRRGREEDKAAPRADSTGLTKRGGREEDKAVPKADSTGLTKRGGREEDKAVPKAEAEAEAEADSTGLTKREGREEDKAVPKAASKAASKAAPKAAPKAAKTDTSKAFGKEQQYQRAQEAAQTPEGQAKRKKIIESQAIENFSPELEVAGGLGALGLKAVAKLLKRGSGKGFFRKDPTFDDFPRVRRGELPAPKKPDSANPSNLSLPKPAPRLGLPRPKGDDISDVVAKRKGGSVQGYASGGSVAASSRGDGIAQRGKTRGRMR